MIIAKFIGLLFLSIAMALVVWFAIEKFILPRLEYGLDWVRVWVKKKLLMSFFANIVGSQSRKNKPDKDHKSGCYIYNTKQVQNWFKQITRIIRAIQCVYHKTSLGLPSHYHYDNGCDSNVSKDSESSLHNRKGIIGGANKCVNRNRGEPK